MLVKVVKVPGDVHFSVKADVPCAIARLEADNFAIHLAGEGVVAVTNLTSSPIGEAISVRVVEDVDVSAIDSRSTVSRVVRRHGELEVQDLTRDFTGAWVWMPERELTSVWDGTVLPCVNAGV